MQHADRNAGVLARPNFPPVVGPPAVRMDWDNLLFLHWPIDVAQLRPLIPAPLEIDTFNGTGWVGLVPFKMANCSFRGVPPLPGLANFYECNVRTYVRHRGVGGVWFFSLDAQTRLPVLGGRWLWNLNYVHSDFAVTRDADAIDYRLSRRRGPWPGGSTHVRWRTGGLLRAGPMSAGPTPVTASPASLKTPPVEPNLATFLTERYWLFTKRRGRLCAGHVRHDPWPLREAVVLDLTDTLISAAGLSISGPPLAMASEHIRVEGYALQRV